MKNELSQRIEKAASLGERWVPIGAAVSSSLCIRWSQLPLRMALSGGHTGVGSDPGSRTYQLGTDGQVP